MSTQTSIRNPRVTLNLVSRDQTIGLDDHRVLLVGQIGSAATAPAGLYVDMPRGAAEINGLFGIDSHMAMVARKFREINPYTSVDAILLDDDGGATQGTASYILAGTATAAKTIFVDIVSSQNHSYEIDVAVGDDEAAINAKVVAKAALDLEKPFTVALSMVTAADDTLTATAANGGTVSNNWLIRVRDAFNRPAVVPGVTITLTGWAGGATDPDVSTALDPVENIRYNGILWPSSYSTAEVKAWIDARFNVDNDIKDGVVFQWVEDTFGNVKTSALAMNSPSFVMMVNETMNTAYWKGPHLPESPDVLATTFLAARARRFEQDISISDLVVTNELNDQFGGRHTASLPYFNTPFLNVGQPDKGSGYTYAEQLELEGAGLSVVGTNVKDNAVISSVMTTTFLNDEAGNPDDTWHYLNWLDSHSVIREMFVNNLRADLDQHRLTTGIAPANYAIATEALIRALLGGYFDILADDAITVKGREARRIFDEKLVVVIDPALRKATIGADVPMVSQLGNIIGTIKFNFAA